MRARNLSDRTITTYLDSASQLAGYAVDQGFDPLSKVAVEHYLADLSDRRVPSTVAFRYRSLQQLFKWLYEEEELDADPMARMRPPKVREQPVPIFSPR